MPPTSLLRVRSEFAALPAALQQVEDELRRAGLGASEATDLRLVAEEVLTNVVKYAFDDSADHLIDVVARVDAHEALLSFRDDGRPFDPLEPRPTDPQSSGPAESVGGLGLVLIDALTDSASYERVDGCNIFSLVKRLPARVAEEAGPFDEE